MRIMRANLDGSQIETLVDTGNGDARPGDKLDLVPMSDGGDGFGEILARLLGLEEKTVTRMLQEMVKTLDPREATILRARFGLDGGPQKTLEEVGQKFGVTRERVRQIQNIALKKLRKMIEKMETTKA